MVVQCINNRTYEHNDIIEKYITLFSQNQTDVTKETVYTVDITTLNFGKSYNIELSYNNEDGYTFFIYLKPGQNYSIYISMTQTFMCFHPTQKYFLIFSLEWRMDNHKSFT